MHSIGGKEPKNDVRPELPDNTSNKPSRDKSPSRSSSQQKPPSDVTRAKTPPPGEASTRVNAPAPQLPTPAPAIIDEGPQQGQKTLSTNAQNNPTQLVLRRPLETRSVSARPARAVQEAEQDHSLNVETSEAGAQNAAKLPGTPQPKQTNTLALSTAAATPPPGMQESHLERSVTATQNLSPPLLGTPQHMSRASTNGVVGMYAIHGLKHESVKQAFETLYKADPTTAGLTEKEQAEHAKRIMLLYDGFKVVAYTGIKKENENHYGAHRATEGLEGYPGKQAKGVEHVELYSNLVEVVDKAKTAKVKDEISSEPDPIVRKERLAGIKKEFIAMKKPSLNLQLGANIFQVRGTKCILADNKNGQTLTLCPSTGFGFSAPPDAEAAKFFKLSEADQTALTDHFNTAVKDIARLHANIFKLTELGPQLHAGKIKLVAYDASMNILVEEIRRQMGLGEAAVANPVADKTP